MRYSNNLCSALTFYHTVCEQAKEVERSLTRKLDIINDLVTVDKEALIKCFSSLPNGETLKVHWSVVVVCGSTNSSPELIGGW